MNLLAVAVLAAVSVLVAQEMPGPPTQVVRPEAPAFRLQVNGGIAGTTEIEAKGIETKAILSQLSRELKIPLIPSRIVADYKVDLVGKRSTIDLLLALAPVVLADIEVSGIGEPANWKAVHLVGYNEREPEPAIKQTGFLVMAGIPPEGGVASTESPEGATLDAATKALQAPKDTDKPVLVVAVTANRVSISARQQPIVALINEVALKAKIPFDMRGAVDMVPIDIEIRDLPLRDLAAALGRPGVRVVVRRNLASGDEVVQGLLAGEARAPTLVPPKRSGPAVPKKR